MKIGPKIHVIIALVAVLIMILQFSRTNQLIRVNRLAQNDTYAYDASWTNRLSQAEIDAHERLRGLILYQDSSALRNVAATLDSLQVDYETLPASQENIDFQVYDLVILLEMDRNDLYLHDQVLDFARMGGLLIYLGNGSGGSGDLLKADASFWGVKQSGKISETNSIFFITELLSGITGAITVNGEFMAPFAFFQSLDVSLDDGSTIHLETGAGNPLIWQKDQMNGRVVVINTGRYDKKEIRGLLAGSIAVARDLFLYPVVGSEVIILDDFPGDYRSSYPILKQQYGRDMQRYILEIWWPQMQALQRAYQLKFTGTFVESFGSQVEMPFESNTGIQLTSIKLISDLLAGEGEVALQGYNHQPLFLSQERAARYGYLAWPSLTEMVESLRQSISFFSQMFPHYTFHAYIPPSNLLDLAALDAVKQAMPDLRLISGIYYSRSFLPTSRGCR